MKNPHRQFPGKMDKVNKKTYKKGYKTLAKGNVKEGYGKLKHVKMFESFDVNESDITELVLRDFKTLSRDEMTKVNALSREEKEEIKLANGYKWFQAQEGSDKFKFLAKDMEDAEATAEMWYAKVIGEVDENMEFETTPMDEAEVNEGSYTDFLTSHGNALQSAVKKMKEIAAVYDEKIEGKADEVDKAMEIYDENVGRQLDSWTGDSNISTDKIAKFAIENQDKYGTEPRMVLDAIDDFHKIMK